LKSTPSRSGNSISHHLEYVLNQAERYHAAGESIQAATLYRTILTEFPHLSRTAYNLGNILKEQEQYGEAETFFRQALATEPEFVEAALNLTFCLQEQGKIEEALSGCTEIVRQYPELPDPRFNLACLRLLTGDLVSGWEGYDLRFATQQPVPARHVAIPRWNGGLHPGLRLLVHTEQGYGDALQMSRYLPQLAQAGLRVWLETTEPLVPLLANLPGLEGCILRGAPLPNLDAQIPIMSLPGIMKTTIDTIPPTPLLKLDEELVRRMGDFLPTLGAPQVGLAWAGRLDLPVNRKRSCPAPLIATLLDIPGITFVSLHKETPDRFSLTAPRLLDLSHELHSFHDTAALIANLDIVITIDTAVAHLAGTMGKPTWLLLPHVPDWRWLLERTDSPWYPSMRLFRQPAVGVWEPVLAEVAQRLVECLPNSAETLTNLGAALDNQGRHEDALACYRAAIARDDTIAVTHYNMGNTLKNLDCPDQAHQAYERALHLNPRIPEAHHNLAIIHQERGELNEAHRQIRVALELRPRFPDALHTLGELFHTEEHFDEAIEAFQTALQEEPTAPRTWNSLGITYQSAERDQQALACYQRALACDPNHLHSLNNLGAVYLALGRPEEGIEHLQRLIELAPDYADAHWNLACCLLACGRYRDGWREYGWRWRKNNPIEERHCHIPRWDGAPLAGRSILLWAEQGFGDTIQFIRYASLVVEQGGNVIVECQTPEISPLLESVAGVDKVIVRGEQIPTPDCQASLLSLPYLLGTTLESIPSPIRYLSVSNERRQRWANLIPKGEYFRVGLVWGGRQTLRNRRRSCRLADFAPLTRLEGITWYSLQVGEQAEEAATPPAGMALQDLTPNIKDFADTAALIDHLDMVVTIDTSVAHLAGALGKPVRLLLPLAADWRWLTERIDTPWYPTMRLLRQQRAGDWHEVVTRLAGEMEIILRGPEEPAVTTWIEQGDLHREKEAWDEALRCYLKALAGNPLHSIAHLRAGGCLIFLNRHEEAKTYLQRASELDPENTDAHINLAIADLATGCLRDGWAEFEWRRRYIIEPFPSIPELPVIRPGDRLDGITILVHSEQGFGDMLQFIRYIPLLAELGGRILLSIPQELVRLFSSCVGVEQVIPHGKQVPITDYQTLLMSLPHLLSELDPPMVVQTPYLAAPLHLVEEWRQRLEPLEGVRIGLAWQGRNLKKSGYRRSLSLEHLAPLLTIHGCSFVALLPGVLLAESSCGTIHDVSPHISDFADTAALISNLDLVISVDTAVAHLAGALGHPCWVALLFSPDWRWHPLNRSDSCWYPSLRLFRQSAPGDWEGVVADLAMRLKEEVLIHQAHALGREGRRSEAIELFREAAAMPAPSPAAWLNLGIYLHADGRTSEARDALKQAVETDPTYPEALQNLGLLHQVLGEVTEAYTCFRRALTLQPDYATARWSLGLLQLLLGEYGEGFKNIEARFRKLDAIPQRHTDLPRWNGEDIREKTVLIHAEQGYGDTIQFLRYVPLLAGQGIQVVVEVQNESLRELAQGVSGQQTVIVRGEPRPTADFQIPMVSLALACGTTVETIPTAPYCTPDANKLTQWRQLFKDEVGLKVGIVWRGRPTPDPRRSIPEQCLAPLFAIPGIRWFSLQVDEDESRPSPLPVCRDHIDRLATFADTAACIAALDLVVSIDTAVAHLAGALGKQTLILLPFAPDWRWMLKRVDSPWYSSAQLFRQYQPGDWSDAVAGLAEALRNMVCE
jgi:tetratricopeptide (TPR) repeat protein